MTIEYNIDLIIDLIIAILPILIIIAIFKSIFKLFQKNSLMVNNEPDTYEINSDDLDSIILCISYAREKLNFKIEENIMPDIPGVRNNLDNILYKLEKIKMGE